MIGKIEKMVLSAFYEQKTISGTALRKKLFNSNRSAQMRSLSILNRNQRGFLVERIVGEHATVAGSDVVYYGGQSSFDILINDKKVEVKSALCRGPNLKFTTNKNLATQEYRWSGIKPECFDYLVLVAATPNGLRYQMLSSADFYYSRMWYYNRSETGYSWYENGKYVRYKMKNIANLGEEITAATLEKGVFA